MIDSPRAISIPVTTTRGAHLCFDDGASRLQLRSGAADGELLGAAWRGVPPAITAAGASVHVRHGRSWWRRARRGGGVMALAAGVPWHVVIRGGAAHVDAQLAGVALAGLAIGGGVADVLLALPVPRGVVPLHVAGGVSQLRLSRPAGVGLRISIAGGASSLVLDDMALGAIGGAIAWQTPGCDAARDRYELTIEGGATGLTLSQTMAPLASAYRAALPCAV